MKTVSGPDAKRAREARGSSQAEVAALLGINRTYYSLFEGGRYLLTDEQEAQLCDFLGIGDQAAGAEDEPDPAAGTEADADADDADAEISGDDPEDADDDPRLSTATAALATVRNVSKETGIDSKRTAAAVAAAAAALEALDYSELRSLDDEANSVLESMPDGDAFAALDSLETKQAWETRIASSLICVALYGETWLSCKCRDLRAAEQAVSESVNNGKSLGIRSERLFGDGEKDRPHVRYELAPHVVNAAQQRRAPRLTELPAKRSSWDM